MSRTFASKHALAQDQIRYFITGEIPTGAVDGSNKTFTLAYSVDLDYAVDIFINGQRITEDDDYTVSGSTITMAYAYPEGTTIRVNYHRLP